MNGQNYEGYSDPTASKAIGTVSKEEQKRVNLVIRTMLLVAEIGWFEVANTIKLRRKRRHD